MTALSSGFLNPGARGAYVVRVTIANAFLLFPLIVAGSESIWGDDSGSAQFKFFIYALTFSIVPLFGVGAYWLVQSCRQHEGATNLLDIALTGPGLIAASLYLSMNESWATIELIGLSGTLAVLIGVPLAFILPRSWKDSCERICRPIVNAIWLASPLAFMAVALLGEAKWLAQHAIADAGFQIGMTVGAVGVAAIYAGPRMLASRSVVVRIAGRLWLAIWATGATVVLLAAIFHPAASCDSSQVPITYGPWVGPAAAVLAGGVPMVDAVSSYGMLGYLVYAAAFKFIFPPSYFAAYAVAQILNLLAVASVIALCLKATRNQFLILVVISAVIPGLPWIWHIDPAIAGARFGPPMLLLLALAWLRPGRTFSLAMIGAIVFCSFWSLEVLLWTVITYTAFLGGVYLEQRDGSFKGRSGSACLVSLALTLSCVVIAHVIFALIVLATSGSWPHYDAYLGFATGYLNNGWAGAKPELANPIWIVEVGICLAALAYALSSVLWRDRADGKARWIAVTLVFPSAVLCVMELSYWVSRTYYGLAWGAVIPSIAALILLLNASLARGFRWGVATPRLESTAHVTLAASIMILIGYLGSFVATNGRNYGPDVATFYYRGVLTGLPVVPCIGQRAADAIALVAKYQPNRRDALFFMPGGDDVSVALFSGHRQRLGYTSMATDFISKPLMVEVDRRMYERIKPGDVLITMAYISISKGVPADGQKLIDNALFGVHFVENLGLLFQECEIERTPRDVVAVRLMPRGDRACEGIGKPFAFEKRYFQF